MHLFYVFVLPQESNLFNVIKYVSLSVCVYVNDTSKCKLLSVRICNFFAVCVIVTPVLEDDVAISCQVECVC